MTWLRRHDWDCYKGALYQVEMWIVWYEIIGCEKNGKGKRIRPAIMMGNAVGGFYKGKRADVLGIIWVHRLWVQSP